MKKIITLILMASMLVACGQTQPEAPVESEPTQEVETGATETETESTELTGVVKEFVEAWNAAGNEARTSIVLSEEGKTVLFHLADDATIDGAVNKCKKDAEKVGETIDLAGIKEYATTQKEANASFVASVAELFSTTTLEELEDATGLASSLAFKFEVSNPELLLDPEAITFVVYQDLHMEVTVAEEVSYYTLTQEAYDELTTIGATYLETLMGQPATCLVQNFKK